MLSHWFRGLYVSILWPTCLLLSCHWKYEFLSGCLNIGSSGAKIYTMAKGGILYSDHIVLHWYKNLITVVHICFWIVAINTFTAIFYCTSCWYVLFVLFCLWAVCCQRQPSVCSELQYIQSQHNNFIYVSVRIMFQPIQP